MTRQQSEGEVHVEAMRLILAEMERREDVPDWTIWQHMLNMLETIFQGIEDQRDDDRDELMHTRKDRDHWRQAREEAHEAGELMRAELEELRKDFVSLQWIVETIKTMAGGVSVRDADGCSLAVGQIQKYFNAAEYPLCNPQQDAAAWQQQVDSANAEVSYLRARLDEERSVSAGLREQLCAANVTILAQKAGNQYLRLLIDKVRAIMNREYNGREFEDIADALNDFDQGTLEPTPCPECERLRVELTKAKDWASHCEEARKDKSAELGFALEECERLQAFAQKARQTIGRTMNFCDVEFLLNALAELDAGAESTPVAEPLDAEYDTCPGK